MKLLFFCSVYFLIISVVFPHAVLVFPISGGELVKLIIFTIGTYWFNISLIIKSLWILIKNR